MHKLTGAIFYNNNTADTASRYEAVSTPMAQCIQTAFAPGCRVLEFGCGSGRDLMCKQGRLIISMPLSRSDIDENNRDTHGRLFSNITAEEIQFLFEQLGFDLLQSCDNEDTLVEQRQQLIIEDCHTTGHRTVDGVLASARTYFPVVTHIAKLLHS